MLWVGSTVPSLSEMEGLACGSGTGCGLLRILNCSERILLPNLRGSFGADIEALRRRDGCGCNCGLWKDRRRRSPLDAGGMMW